MNFCPTHRVAMLVVAAIALSSCGHTPLTSIYKLNKIDPKTTSLKQLRVAVQIPDSFEPTKSGVVLITLLEKHNSDPSIAEHFKLKRIAVPDDASRLKKYVEAKRKFHVFKIANQDIQRFERFRNLQAGTHRKEKPGEKQGGKRPGSISVVANVCRRTKNIPSKIEISTFIKTSETREFVPARLNEDILDGAEIKNPDDFAPLCE